MRSMGNRPHAFRDAPNGAKPFCNAIDEQLLMVFGTHVNRVPFLFVDHFLFAFDR